MITAIKEVLTGIISRFGYVGILGIMTIDACFVPLQSEISLPLAGFLASEGDINAFSVVFIGAFGNTFGAFIMYLLGSRLAEKKIIELIEKYGKFLLLKKEDYTKVKELFSRKGAWFVLLGRLLPGVRSVMSLPAGVLKIPLGGFLTFTFIGSGIWSAILVFLGYKLGENWIEVESHISKFENYVIAGGVILISLYIWRKLRHPHAGTK